MLVGITRGSLCVGPGTPRCWHSAHFARLCSSLYWNSPNPNPCLSFRILFLMVSKSRLLGTKVSDGLPIPAHPSPYLEHSTARAHRSRASHCLSLTKATQMSCPIPNTHPHVTPPLPGWGQDITSHDLSFSPKDPQDVSYTSAKHFLHPFL